MITSLTGGPRQPARGLAEDEARRVRKLIRGGTKPGIARAEVLGKTTPEPASSASSASTAAEHETEWEEFTI